MIPVHYHDDRYIAMGNAYAYKERIKALAQGEGDVKYHAATKRWLVHYGLWDALVEELGEHLVLTVEAACRMPVSAPKRRKGRREQQIDQVTEKKAIRHWGKQFSQMAKEKRGA